MDVEVVTAWFIVWSTGALLLVGFLVIVNVLAEYRRLRRVGMPRPFFILWQRTVARLIPARAAQRDLEGRLVWLKWDVRWVTAGQSTARVVAVGVKNDILLRLETPILVYGDNSTPDVKLENVRFVPRSQNVPRYGRCAISGTLEPSIMPQLHATATIVVYPVGA